MPFCNFWRYWRQKLAYKYGIDYFIITKSKIREASRLLVVFENKNSVILSVDVIRENDVGIDFLADYILCAALALPLHTRLSKFRACDSLRENSILK